MRYLICILLFTSTVLAQRTIPMPVVTKSNVRHRIRAKPIPPVIEPSSQLKRIIQPEDISAYHQFIESFEVNSQGVRKNEKLMFDLSDVKFVNGKVADINDTLVDPLNGWLLGVEDIKRSWRPQHFTFETKYPTRIDTIKYWSGNNLSSTSKGVGIYGSNDGVSWVQLTDILRWGFSRKFNNLILTDTTHYTHFKIERWNDDPRGYGTNRTNNELKLIFIAHTDSSRAINEYLTIDELPTPNRTFREKRGENAWYYDSLKFVTEYAAISQFTNMNWCVTGLGQPFAIRRNWKEAYYYYLSEANGGNEFPDGQGRPILMFRDGYPELFAAWKRGGVNFNFQRFQLNTDAWMASEFQQIYEKPSALGGDSIVQLSNTMYLTDTIYGFPEWFGAQPKSWTDTAVGNEWADTTYDYRPLLTQMWDSTHYDIGQTGTDWVGERFWSVTTKEWSSIKDAMIMPADWLAGLADPAKEDSLINALVAYRELGELFFNYTAVYGRNSDIPLSDLRVLTIERIVTGLDLVQAMSLTNEFDKYWRDGLGRSIAKMLGMLFSILSDGHGGLLQDSKGGYRVGAHTADPTMWLIMGSELQADLPMSIEAMRWCEYFRARDFHLMPDNHPYSGVPKHIKLDRIGFDFHDYRSTSGSSNNQEAADGIYAATFELAPNANDVFTSCAIIRKEWPDAIIVCSEFGYSGLKGHRFAAAWQYFNNADSTSFNPDYDLTYAQASNNCWDFMHRDRLLDYYFHYETVDENTYYAPVDTSTTPYTIDRQHMWANGVSTGFPDLGLRTHTNIASPNEDQAGVAKPSWYASDAQLDLIGESHQVGYTYDTTNLVAYFTYYDSISDYYTLAIRRVTNVNDTTLEYTVDIPTGYNNVTRIEPIRNEPALPVTDLGSITSYTADIREKLFFLKCEP